MESAYATAHDDAPATARRVLVVDDDADIRELVGLKLEQAGYEVVTADDGAAALSVVEGWVPDLVVLDVAMPGLSGFDVCKRLRADPVMAKVPVIMLTARTLATYLTLGYMAGADLYLTKPFSPRELVERVGSLLAEAPPRFADKVAGDHEAPGQQWEYPAEQSTSKWWRR